MTDQGHATTKRPRDGQTCSCRWPTFASAGAAAVGVAWAAAFATRGDLSPVVGTTAWVAASLIGTAAVASAGVVERHRPPPPPAQPTKED